MPRRQHHIQTVWAAKLYSVGYYKERKEREQNWQVVGRKARKTNGKTFFYGLYKPPTNVEETGEGALYI